MYKREAFYYKVGNRTEGNPENDPFEIPIFLLLLPQLFDELRRCDAARRYGVLD
jgi:hypothetical protein